MSKNVVALRVEITVSTSFLLDVNTFKTNASTSPSESSESSSESPSESRSKSLSHTEVIGTCRASATRLMSSSTLLRRIPHPDIKALHLIIVVAKSK